MTNRRNFIKGLTTAGIAAGAGAIASRTAQHPSVDTKESVFDRVMKHGEIRIGYVQYHPHLFKDPNSGQLKGFYYDIINGIGEQLGLKINWLEEVSFATMIDGLNRDRYDLVGLGIFESGQRARGADFSEASHFEAIYACVRHDDQRFSTLNQLNNPHVTIATIEGEIADNIVQSDFPDITVKALPNSSNLAQTLQDVFYQKADVAFVPYSLAQEYMLNNPGQIKMLAQPVRVF